MDISQSIKKSKNYTPQISTFIQNTFTLATDNKYSNHSEKPYFPNLIALSCYKLTLFEVTVYHVDFF